MPHPTFGRYELLKRLAGGGMGEVYLARQRGLEGFSKLLVIKTLLPHLCEDEEFITMFKDEARLTAKLIHPNICQVFEFDQVENTYFLAMEYLRGEDLRKLWRACEQKGRPLPVPLILRILADAAAGLDFAHALRDEKGEPYHIVHRDISPQNILVTFEGGVKVIDFGVAKAAGRAQHTRTGALKGKYSYMSPEQVSGANIDGRSDIFALGIVLHELLTGRRLFKADSDVQTLARVREAVVAPPSRLNPQLPRGLDEIVLKALARDPEQRYLTGQEFRLALEDYLISQGMRASTAHLAELLKFVYAERLEKEAKFGPLLGEKGLEATDPGANTPSQPTPSLQMRGPPPVSGTVNQRTPTGPTASTASEPGKSVIGPDMNEAPTLSVTMPFGLRKQTATLLVAMAVALGAVAYWAIFVRAGSRAGQAQVAVAAASLVVSSEPAGATVTLNGAPIGQTPAVANDLKPGDAVVEVKLEGYKPASAKLTLAPGANQHQAALERAGPRTFRIQLDSTPQGARVVTADGAELGTTPAVWRAEEGKQYELTFTLEGHRPEKKKVLAFQDGQSVAVPLQKAERRQAAPGLNIKVER